MPSPAPPSEYLSQFGLKGFRPGQQDVIQSVLDGKDVLCVMPTGGGKSLCYQLPSLMLDGLTIVVSPLIALMKDQVDTLQKKGFRAALINSSLTAAEQFDRMQTMADGKYDLVYIAPERLRNSRFLECVRQTKVSLLAVDEAHCISEWGHDFRPDYARLGQFRVRHLGGVQTIALTATATPTVREDIVRLLSLHQPRPFVTGFARKNLRFAVSQCSSDREKDDRLSEFLDSHDGTGIIYAATRKRCEEIAEWLPGKLGKPVGIYHGGLEPAQRRKIQEQFMGGKLAAIVATNAFGMGIDKSDIRYVVHYNMPGSLEAYYQEAGRAGRDGLPSECLLLFSYSDRYIQEFFIDNNYPPREVVQKVYEFLQGRPEDPIELTLDQIREMTRVQVGSEAIGTAERLLAKSKVLERLDSSANQAVLRIDSELPTLADLLPREAKVRRRILQAAEKIVGDRRGEEVYFPLDRLVRISEQSRESVVRTLRELCKLRDFDYVPPFRGRAIHFRKHGVPFGELEIDFAEMDRRKKADYEKLDQVIRFAQTPGCRQLAVLNYFGDPDAEECGNCDRCDAKNPKPKVATGKSFASSEPPVSEQDQELLTRVVRIVLSGIARTHGRFGKGLIAQMLSGSQNKKLQQLKLNRLSTYGLLRGLKQAEVAQLLEAVCSVGMAEQIEVTQRRPTVKLTAFGQEVMKGVQELPHGFSVPRALQIRAIAVTRSAASDEKTDSPASPKPVVDAELVKQLRDWRREAADELGIPAYRIFSNATLESIAVARPSSVGGLEAISGVGSGTIEQFGYTIVELLRSFGDDSSDCDQDAEIPCSEQSERTEYLDPSISEISHDSNGGDSEAVSEPTSPTAYWTWKLLADGYTAEECCEIRGIEHRELIKHLIEASAGDHPVQLDWVAGEDSELLDKIAASEPGAADDLLPSRLNPLLLQLARANRLANSGG